MARKRRPRGKKQPPSIAEIRNQIQKVKRELSREVKGLELTLEKLTRLPCKGFQRL